MSGLPKNHNLLVDWFPRAGFRWRQKQGSPRILRSDARDAVVRRAIVDLLGNNGGGKIRKRDAQHLVVQALLATAKIIGDGKSGIRPGEDMIEFLERSAEFSDLSQAIPEDVWVELVYQIANARNEYKRHTPAAQKKAEEDRLTDLAFAIDDLLEAAGRHWGWMTMEFYAYPHLMGEAVDYDVDDTDEDSSSSDDDKADKDVDMADDEGNKELPGRMEELTIEDADGDVEMAM